MTAVQRAGSPSVVTWFMPSLTAVFAAIAYDNALLGAIFFS